MNIPDEMNNLITKKVWFQIEGDGYGHIVSDCANAVEHIRPRRRVTKRSDDIEKTDLKRCMVCWTGDMYRTAEFVPDK